jgi:hypothetical protein
MEEEKAVAKKKRKKHPKKTEDDDNSCTNLKITSRKLTLMQRQIKIKPIATLQIEKVIDIYNLKRNSPTVEPERLYRLGLAHLPHDDFIHKFCIRLRNFNTSVGINQVCIEVVTKPVMEKWQEYKAIQKNIEGFNPHKEGQAIDIKKFVEFCRENEIHEEQLWNFLLDDTYSKSKEISLIFHPQIIPIPHYESELQKYNSHGIILSNSKSGKSETCFRLYPQANFEEITVPTLLGTAKDGQLKTGLLDGQGVILIDEINKRKDEEEKILDKIKTYLEKGMAQRGIWGMSASVKGTKCVIFAGNADIMTSSPQRNLMHLLGKIFSIGGDSDAFGRRLGFLVYNTKMNEVTDSISEHPQAMQVLNCFRKEITHNESLNKDIIRILYASMDWINDLDNDHKEKILEFIPAFNYDAIKAFIKGLSISSHIKLKFMAVRSTINNHIFEIIENPPKNFFEKHKQEILCKYEELKTYLIYNTLEILTEQQTNTLKDKIISYILENKIDINSDIKYEDQQKIAEHFKTGFPYIRKIIHKIRNNNLINKNITE